MSTTRVNPMEQDVHDLADAYVDLVNDLVEEFAPFRPWWTRELSPDEALWRYMEVRDKIVPWLVEIGVYMGFKTWQDELDNIEKVWMSHLPIDTVPPQLLAGVPIELLELVQAGPYDAATHIREMEKLFARRQAAATALQKAATSTTEPNMPGFLPPSLPAKAGEIYPPVSPEQFHSIVRSAPRRPRGR